MTRWSAAMPRPLLFAPMAMARSIWEGDQPDRALIAWADAFAPAADWGSWAVSDPELKTVCEIRGIDVVDLGCRTGYRCGLLARMGARPVGVDVRQAHLDTARALQREHGLSFPLVAASVQAVALPGAAFDLAFSEYGAPSWSDPYAWISEAARLLRPGGRLVFWYDPRSVPCAPNDDPVAGPRPHTGLQPGEWPRLDQVEPGLHRGLDEMCALLAHTGFRVERLLIWPAKEIWFARRTA